MMHVPVVIGSLRVLGAPTGGSAEVLASRLATELGPLLEERDLPRGATAAAVGARIAAETALAVLRALGREG